MDNKTLYEAAREGNIYELQKLLAEDPLLLDKVVAVFTETPLHTAALAGKSEFVKQVLRHAPWLATQQSSRHGANALHMAAAKGHVDVVTALLDFNHHLDLTFDVEGCGPLHYAAYHGRSEVVRVLVSRNFSLLKQVNFVGETALHVAAKSNQQEVIRVIEKRLKDEGNAEFCEDLLMHVKDKYGYSVAKLLVASSYKGNNLFQAYVSKICQIDDEGENNADRLASISADREVPSKQLDEDNESETSLEIDMFLRQVILVILVLIATVTFQSLISPPQSLWKDGGLKPELFHQFIYFLVYNTAAFLISCWGLMAAFMREDLKMTFFWLGSSISFVFISYLSVLLPMIEGVGYKFLQSLLIAISLNLFLSVVLCSNTFRKLCAKIKKSWRRFANRRTEVTANEANTNSMVAMSSTTSEINNPQV